MVYELILINEIEQRAKLIFLSVVLGVGRYNIWFVQYKSKLHLWDVITIHKNKRVCVCVCVCVCVWACLCGL